MADRNERGVRVSSRILIPESDLSWRFSGSGGPGGQHANTANTKVDLRFDVVGSEAITPAQRQRLLHRYGPEIRVVEVGHRSQARNRDVALRRLAQKVREGLVVTPTRRATRPGRGAVERRLTAKKQTSQRKSSRRRPTWGPESSE